MTQAAALLGGREPAQSRASLPASRPITDCCVLIVEDNETSVMLLEGAARQLGIGRVEVANDGVAALRRLAFDPKPDLILLDILMPEMDGFETCRRIRLDPRLADLPVIIQTALASNQDRVQCFRAGATDVVSKPLNLQELIARMRVHLENRLLISTLSEFHDRLDRDLTFARRMQRSIIPNTSQLSQIAEANALRLEAVYEPCDEVGGDLWTCRDLGQGRVAVFVADCSSHGLVAAINAFRLHGIAGRLDADPTKPGAWLTRLNQTMTQEFGTDSMATAFYGVIESETGKLTYAAAGSPPPLLCQPTPDGALAMAEINTRGMMLGIDESIAYEERVVTIPTGSGLLLFSDVIVEARDAFGIEITTNNVIDWTLEAATRNFANPLGEVLERFAQRVAPPWADDLTMVWIARP
ncbi:MAG: PP2C family protein-serine/threonine phosphatase [Elsteraceae bacterium]